ncbi:hypothetical protein BT96DRAFT_913053, partial [Gymnopus androsaceus JB14]
MFKPYLAEESLMQIGENEDSLIDFTSMQNAADAHLLAADRLASPISPEYPVAGEAFFITNGDPMSVWDLWRRIYARFDEYFPGKIVAPRMTLQWLALGVARGTEIYGWKPPLVTRESLMMGLTPHWY